jgi:HPt (histidine-containing phosphotransfer) domain-containing protein
MSEPLPPIRSTRENDPEATSLIDAFVIRLAEDVDSLQDAQSDDDLKGLAERASQLAERAGKAGYPDLVRICQTLMRACIDEKPEDAEAAIVQLTDVSVCIRQGHRGAA